MKMMKTSVLSLVLALILIGTTQAEDTPLKGIKLGFGFDRGFGIVGTMGKFNGFLGDDGIAVDYIFMKKKLNEKNPLYWYVGGGGYGDWDGDLGVRLPVGGEFYFTKQLDAYAQIIPRFRFNNNTDFGLDFGIGVRYQF